VNEVPEEGSHWIYWSDAKEVGYGTPLDAAVKNGHFEAVKFLLEQHQCFAMIVAHSCTGLFKVIQGHTTPCKSAVSEPQVHLQFSVSTLSRVIR
jgi:hypothetical protein